MTNLQAEVDKLINNLWGRALDMTSDDFSNDKDYLKAKKNYRNQCLKELLQLLDKSVGEIIGEEEAPVPIVPGTHNASRNWQGYRALERFRNALREEQHQTWNKIKNGEDV